MTFEYMGAHPRASLEDASPYGGKISSGPEERLEDTVVVAELRVAVAKEDVIAAGEDPTAR